MLERSKDDNSFSDESCSDGHLGKRHAECAHMPAFAFEPRRNSLLIRVKLCGGTRSMAQNKVWRLTHLLSTPAWDLYVCRRHHVREPACRTAEAPNVWRTPARWWPLLPDMMCISCCRCRCRTAVASETCDGAKRCQSSEACAIWASFATSRRQNRINDERIYIIRINEGKCSGRRLVD